MQWNDSYQASVHSFANNINTHEGGTHLTGFRSALTRTVNAYARSTGLIKEKDEPLGQDDAHEGLVAIISVKLSGSAVRGADEDEARQLADAQPGRDDHQRRARRVVRGAPRGGPRDHQQGAAGSARPPGRAQGARPRAPQDRARELAAAGQAQGLLQQRSGAVRAVPGRGQQRRRHRRRRARPRVPGDPAAARQDPQRREGADQQDPLERRDPGHDHDDQHGHRRGVQPRGPALPQDRRDDRCRRRRRAHPHADPDVLLPPHAADDRGRPRLHRAAAALPAQVRPPRGALPPERQRARAHPAARAAGRHRGGRPLRRVAALHRGALPALPLGAARVRGLGRAPALRVRRRRRSTTSRITA